MASKSHTFHGYTVLPCAFIGSKRWYFAGRTGAETIGEQGRAQFATLAAAEAYCLDQSKARE